MSAIGCSSCLRDRELTMARLSAVLSAAVPKIISLTFDANGSDAEDNIFFKQFSARLAQSSTDIKLGHGISMLRTP